MSSPSNNGISLSYLNIQNNTLLKILNKRAKASRFHLQRILTPSFLPRIPGGTLPHPLSHAHPHIYLFDTA
jgi:hypothetical protein